MHFHIITLFPDAFDSYLGESILKRAIEDKKIKVSFYNPRDFTKDKWKRIDRRPYAGGPGMVIEPESVLKAAKKAIGKKNKKDVCILFFSPGGKQFETKDAKTFANKYKHIVMISGRYEGIDARVQKILKAKEYSIGPYVLTGGELPAMVLIDSISRQIEGVLGSFDSLEESRVASHDVYTRPEVFVWNGKKYRVPKVLLSGDHKKIEEWKARRSGQHLPKTDK
jgi:tRNA (guanine37-N1)-methyltransferase